MRPSRRNRNAPHWPPTLLLLAAFALRIYRLGAANLWWDEALAVWATRKGLAGVTLWTAGDVHPPLYFWSLWAWIQLVGESEFATRLLSAILGTLTVALIYRLGKELDGPRTGLMAAALVALARFHVWWSQELRMYVLAGLLGSASLYFFSHWLQETWAQRDSLPSPVTGVRRHLILASLCSLASLYTIYLSAIFLLAESVAVLLLIWQLGRTRARMAVLRQWGASQALVLVGLAPWLAFSWQRMSTWSAVSQPSSPLSLLALGASLLTTGISVNVERYAWFALVPLAVLGLGLAALLSNQKRQSERRQQLLLVTAPAATVLLSIGIIYAASLPRGLFYTPQIEARYLLPFAPAFWLLLAYSIERALRRWRIVGCLAGLALATTWLYVLPGYYADRCLQDELQSMVRTIASQSEPGDIVLLDSGSRYPVFLYYYERLSESIERPPFSTVTRAERPITKEEVESWMDDNLPNHPRVWLAEVEVELSDPQRLAAESLSQRYTQVSCWGFAHNRLCLFATEPAPLELDTDGYLPQHVVDVTLPGGGLLWGWELPVERFTAGGEARLALLWKEPPPEPVAIWLQPATGQEVLRLHSEAPKNDRPLRQHLNLPIIDALPPGDYSLWLEGYGDNPLTTLRIEGTRPLPSIGPPQVDLDLHLGDQMALYGYALHSTKKADLADVAAGESLVLDLYWKASEKPQEAWIVFTHLLGTAYNERTQGPVWGQHDGAPFGNKLSTTGWQAGDAIVDRHVISIQEDAPPGDYSIEIGLYVKESGERLEIRTSDGGSVGDHLILDVPVRIR